MDTRADQTESADLSEIWVGNPGLQQDLVGPA